MRHISIKNDRRRIASRAEIVAFETKMGFKFPEVLIEFLLRYEGARLSNDNKYHVKGGEVLQELNQVLFLRKSNQGGASIEAILGGHREMGIKGFIPFGTDSGGWDYSISINPDSYGQVWVNKFDSGEEDTMEFVSSSFEEFINELGPEPED